MQCCLLLHCMSLQLALLVTYVNRPGTSASGRLEPLHTLSANDCFLREADPRHEAANLTDDCQRNREQESVCSNCRNPQGGRRNRDRLVALILIQGLGACSVDPALVATTFGGL